MRKLGLLTTLFLLVALMSFRKGRPSLFVIPDGWPKPVYNFKKDLLTSDKIALGKMLFYDPILSRDSTISCNSCHTSYSAFTHLDHNLSHGIEGKIGTRNSPALMNLAWSKNFMWDGAVTRLDKQALNPITNPLEMDERIEHVVAKLQSSLRYRSFFYKAYGDSVITGDNLFKSLSQFMLTLVSANAKYDRVKRGVEQFTQAEQKGYLLFQKNCSACHTEPLFTNDQFENNGLTVDAQLKDLGKMKVTGRSCDSLKFKVPTLRNVQYSYPYMHDGRFKNLKQVLNNYVMGVQHSPTLSPLLQHGIYMTAEEKGYTIAFLCTLTDSAFLHNPDFLPPQNNL